MFKYPNSISFDFNKLGSAFCVFNASISFLILVSSAFKISIANLYVALFSSDGGAYLSVLGNVFLLETGVLGKMCVKRRIVDIFVETQSCHFVIFIYHILNIFMYLQFISTLVFVNLKVVWKLL